HLFAHGRKLARRSDVDSLDRPRPRRMPVGSICTLAFTTTATPTATAAARIIHVRDTGPHPATAPARRASLPRHVGERAGQVQGHGPPPDDRVPAARRSGQARAGAHRALEG